MTTHYLEPADVPANWRNLLGYKGRKFRTEICLSVTPRNMEWSGGTRSEYLAFNTKTSEQRAIVDRRPFPHNHGPAPAIDIEPDWIVVEHVLFCGKDHGLVFHVRPEMATGLLPAPDDGDDDVSLLCVATATLKNSYGGRSNIRFQESQRAHGITRERWDAAFARALELKLIRRNGAITPAGRNRANANRSRFRIY